jgi:uncharacterized repeat protein (TIGR03803 family)
MLRAWLAYLFFWCPPLKIEARLVSHFALAGIGSLVFTGLAPLPTFATPEITLQGSFAADGSNGSNPHAALTAAGNGIYYGTTWGGGSNNTGSIFKFDSATGSITLQDSFTGSNGARPYATLTAAGNGIYYGTTEYGGSNDRGSIFKFDSATGSIALQHSFTEPNGSGPRAALTAAGNGIYYGTTFCGGTIVCTGTIFQFDSATGSFTLQGILPGSNGARIYAPLTAAGNGIYYGTTWTGGSGDTGSVFQFDSATGSITLQASFTGTNGSSPNAALTAAGNGIYYGTTVFGGSNGLGSIFKFDSATGSITPQASFTGSSGTYPFAAMTAAGNGIYYGTTYSGGNFSRGSIFQFDSATGSITLQALFTGSNGAGPYAALTAAGNGIYFGTTQYGGSNNTGSIFKFDSGVRNSNPVPGPLPLLGATAAFGWSRKLRRRIQPVRSVFPIDS